MRYEISLDTETTGFDPATGDRIVEIGAIELLNFIPTGRKFHVYINPERDVPAEATRVHGLTEDFLKDKPVFAEIVDDFLEFIGDYPLVIHNAAFDMRFLNHELAQAGREALAADRAIDTMEISKQRFPGGVATLDVLCRRLGVDTSNRVLHGALLDADLLASAYSELNGGRSPKFNLEAGVNSNSENQVRRGRNPARQRPIPLPSRISEIEQKAHTAMMSAIAKKAPSLAWAEMNPQPEDVSDENGMSPSS